MRAILMVPTTAALAWVSPPTMTPKGRRLQASSSTDDASHQSLFNFAEDTTACPDVGPLEFWERIDDVVMGGSSSSGLRAGGVWSGIIRTEGGGFAGTRTKRLERPMDLSLWDGIYLDSRTRDAELRSWKCTLRCTKDSGEVVYNCEIKPGGRSYAAFHDFRLVRGPRFIQGAPPLSSELLKSVYGIGLTCSKFDVNGTVMTDFKPGFFRVDIDDLGVYGSFWPKLAQPPRVTLSPPSETNPSRPNSANSQNLLFKALTPLTSFVFSEKARRRKRARTLLDQRLMKKMATKPPFFSSRLYGQKVIKRGVKNMTSVHARTEGINELLTDLLSAVLAFPLRILFRIIFTCIRILKRIKIGTPPQSSSSSQVSAPAV